jgi:predicted unusual protein kinase regulating ubiquinone biosynthesis (AarF/ABC1/UbiB family)
MNDDNDTLAARALRFARVGATMGGLGARLAGERFLGLAIERDSHAAGLKAALGGLKGPLMKVAQILAAIPGALPEEYAVALAELQANAPPMGWLFVRRRMAAELGPDWQEKLGSFEPVASFAASLGQVHRATLKTGEAVACKLQYPNMGGAVESDLAQFKLVMSMFESYDRAVATREVQAELGARLREELDYAREARQMRLYANLLADEAGIAVPTPVEGLSTPRLLTMRWLEGTPLLQYTVAHPEQTDQLAEALFRAWYVPLYHYGVIHGDPHPGNYTVSPEGKLNLLDFGCIRIFPPSFVRGVIDLYRALQTGDETLARHAFASWGFHDLTPRVYEALSRWARFLYAPLLDDRVRLINEDEGDKGVFGQDIAAHVHKELRASGGISVPREFVFMDRAALGLGSMFLRLGARQNWHRLFEGLIRDFDEPALAARQHEALISVGLL